MRHFKLCGIVLALVVGLVAFSTFPAAAATMSTKNTTSAHHAASYCTPGYYHPVYFQYIYDASYGTQIGEVEIEADGCGWVHAWAESGRGGGVINHLSLNDINGGMAVTTASYNGSYYNQTIHIPTNGRCIYAYAVIQVFNAGYWGSNITPCIDGKSYF